MKHIITLILIATLMGCKKEEKEAPKPNCDQWLLARQQQHDAAVHGLHGQFPNSDDAQQLASAIGLLTINAQQDQQEAGCCCRDL